ncbi:hypothetical protein A2U01_0084615, partial [Trifolium medium]|nr:hypothetical protein [Trifolium medium]
MNPFTLASQIAYNRLYSTSHTPQTIITHPHKIRVFACWKSIKFLIHLVRMYCISL